MNFELLMVFLKVFSAKFGDMVSIGSTSKQSAKVFSAKIVFSTNSQKFSTSKVFLQYVNKPPTIHTQSCTQDFQKEGYMGI